MKVFTTVFLLIAALVFVASAQDEEAASLTGVCWPNTQLLAHTAADEGDDDNGDGDDDDDDDDTDDDTDDDDSSDSNTGVKAGAASLVATPLPRRCEDGPARKIHTVRGEFHWPPIYRGSCDDLRCADPPCFARKTVWRFRCVLVYKLIDGCWKRIGYRIRRYLDHLKCGCKQCEDIKTRPTCIATKPCPNSNNDNTNCYWKFGIFPIGKRQVSNASTSPIPIPLPIPIPIGRCLCCKQFPCLHPKIFSRTSCSCVCPPTKCRPGRIFNPNTCKCDCPRGSKDVNGRCIGDCDDFNVGVCPFINCADSPHLRCTVQNKKCVCPSCDANRVANLCLRTKCQEQRGKPTCVYDSRSRKCRCPQCSDITDRFKCIATRQCPESKISRSFCYWKPTLKSGECDCCIPPLSCPKPKIFDRNSCSCVCPKIRCPPGRVQNSSTCRCDCVRGTREVNGRCVADCDNLRLSLCPVIHCEDNPHFKCAVKVINHQRKCVCPSCDASTNAVSCSRTKCLEQISKVKCVYDYHANKCRCPKCSDQKDKKWCLLTYCGPNNHLQCRYNSHKKDCFCPH